MIRILDKPFETFIEADEIQKEVQALAHEINRDYAGKEILFIAVLNGAFMFASDLYKHIEISSEITFVKLNSYRGTASRGSVDELIGLNVDVQGKHVLIVEDIVDTGKTVDAMMALLKDKNPSSVKLCSLLFKPAAFHGNQKPDYVGFSIPNTFVVGYGLDYNEKGRNLNAIYQIREQRKLSKKMLNIVLFGPPGSGKGTQSVLLKEKYGLVHISTGDVFRALDPDSELGKLARSYADKGNLVPDDVTIQILQEEVNKYPEAKGVIYDGFPRTSAQAEALDKFLSDKNDAVSLMLSLDVPEEELRTRLKKRAEISGRADDADPTVIQTRIETYNSSTAPVADFYEEQGKLVEINGVGEVSEITERLFNAIEALN